MVSMRNSREIKGYVQQRSLKCQSTIGNEPKRLSSEDGAHCHVWMVFPLPPVARFFPSADEFMFCVATSRVGGRCCQPKISGVQVNQNIRRVRALFVPDCFCFQTAMKYRLARSSFLWTTPFVPQLKLEYISNNSFHQIWFWDVFALEGVLPWRGSCASATSSIRHLTHFS